MIKCALLDLAGVVYDGKQPIAGSLDAIDRLRRAGLGIRFLTNTTRTPRRLLLARLQAMGLVVADEELFTPAGAACNWLQASGFTPHLLVHPMLTEDFARCPAEGPPALVVGDAGDGFTFAAMNNAFRVLSTGAPFLALARNRVFRDADGELSLDAGPFVEALAFASQKEPLVLGKPSPDFFKAALANLGCAAEDAVMIGDDAESDVAGALAAGIGKALLVRTGKYRPGDETGFEPYPSAVVENLAAAVAWVRARCL